MGLQQQEELFCEIGISLGYLTKEQINKAIGQLSVDKTKDKQKPIGGYFISENVLSKEQFGEIVAEVRRKQNTQSQINDEDTTPLNISDLTLEEGESIEEKYCPNCDAYVPVKVTKRSRDYLGCGLGCLGMGLNFILMLVTFGAWGSIWVSFAIGMLLRPAPNDLIVCLKCNMILKK